MNTSVGEQTAKWAQENSLQSHYFPSIDSTNNFAKALEMSENARFALVVSDHQTHGRGRGERSWSDHAHGNYLLSSWVFILTHPVQYLASPLLGLAVLRSAAATWTDLPWSIKAPNDLWLGDKKVGGLLTEIVSSGGWHKVVIGFGMNVLEHPEEISTATHLTAFDPAAMDRWPIFLSHLLMEMHKALVAAQKPSLDERTRRQLVAGLNQNPILSEPFIDVDKEGNLHTAQLTIPWTQL